MILVASRSAISLTPDPHETGNSQVSPERRLNRNPQPTHRMRSFARFPPYGGANRTSRENRTRGCPPSASHGEWTSKLTRLLRQNNGCPSLPWVSKSSMGVQVFQVCFPGKMGVQDLLQDFPSGLPQDKGCPRSSNNGCPSSPSSLLLEAGAPNRRHKTLWYDAASSCPCFRGGSGSASNS
jgi:hypothetical protein